MLKRLFDILVSLGGLVITSLLLACIAVLIRWEGPGPVFYRGFRVGRYGKLFRIFKFRSMVIDTEEQGACSTANDDLRITKIGRILRRHKLDELPQLLNILKGDMSLVGPRPEVQRFVDLYTEEEKVILTVRPGLTDWASMWNIDEGAILQGSSDPDRAYLELIRPTKIRFQLAYVQHAGFLTDLRILLLTLAMLVFRMRLQEVESVEIRA